MTQNKPGLAVVGSLLLIVLAQAYLLPDQNIGAIFFILFISYSRNVAYGLTSRAKQRNNVVYHFIASTISNLVFFMLMQSIFKYKLSIMFLTPYIAGNVAGSINGAKVSDWIERRIGASVQTKKLPELRPKIISLVSIIVAGILFQTIVFPDSPIQYTLLISAVAFSQECLHTILTRAGNKDKYSFTIISALIKGPIEFVLYKLFDQSKLNWGVSAPFISANIAGSISGSLTAQVIEHKLKASADNHVLTKIAPKFPYAILLSLIISFLIYELFIPPSDFISTGVTLGYATLIHISYHLISRARNRDNVLAHSIASILSNGIWFLMLRHLVVSGLPLFHIVPYTLGTAIGSIIGPGLSMWLEIKIQSLADSQPVTTQV